MSLPYKISVIWQPCEFIKKNSVIANQVLFLQALYRLFLKILVLKYISFKRLVIQKTLNVITTTFKNKLFLFLCLYSFTNHIIINLSEYMYQTLQYLSNCFIIHTIAYKTLVKFNNIYRKCTQCIKCTVSNSKIIHAYFEAIVSKLGNFSYNCV